MKYGIKERIRRRTKKAQHMLNIHSKGQSNDAKWNVLTKQNQKKMSVQIYQYTDIVEKNAEYLSNWRATSKDEWYPQVSMCARTIGIMIAIAPCFH